LEQGHVLQTLGHTLQGIRDEVVKTRHGLSSSRRLREFTQISSGGVFTPDLLMKERPNKGNIILSVSTCIEVVLRNQTGPAIDVIFQVVSNDVCFLQEESHCIGQCFGNSSHLTRELNNINNGVYFRICH